jgi:peptidoglycan/LPS O-acetylase OafA/YrhL
MPVLLAVRRLPLVPAEIKAWIALGLAIGVASLAYRYIERPFIERASRWS